MRFLESLYFKSPNEKRAAAQKYSHLKLSSDKITRQLLQNCEPCHFYEDEGELFITRVKGVEYSERLRGGESLTKGFKVASYIFLVLCFVAVLWLGMRAR